MTTGGRGSFRNVYDWPQGEVNKFFLFLFDKCIQGDYEDSQQTTA